MTHLVPFTLAVAILGFRPIVIVVTGAGCTDLSDLAARISVEQLCNVGLHIHPLQSPLEALWINANGECCHPGQRSIVLYTLWCALYTTFANLAKPEVRTVPMLAVHCSLSEQRYSIWK